ncbi:hypothetical protein SAMN05428642_104158 [Flaviramulus basaltis]|uniref:Deoxyribose-phosphate aldolase n=1 Tax=Flaviramulus basaltis TaxID=369401 RepID=A0A1K2IPT8_9FLAO|nr:DUF6503 family protein [Flaviramulus basaltis]SFZ94399.1 hypothetical protein SAMN05428642_104158 [Flaviramulus basaltis]
MKKIIFSFTFLILVLGCKQELQNANEIIDKSIEVSGGELFKKSTIDFNFRDKHYKAIREKGKFQFEREFKDSLGIVKDVLNNKGFMRFVNNFPMAVRDSMAAKYTASVNSVHYFSVLPFGLNDAAVNKTYLGKVEIKGGNYYKIKVTFNQKGGGEDFEDVFVYWVDNKTYKVVYLAYSYNEKEGKGFRFREAYNERYINGIRFVDYNNYKPKVNDVILENIDVLFEKDELELLSKIELENISVSINSI